MKIPVVCSYPIPEDVVNKKLGEMIHSKNWTGRGGGNMRMVKSKKSGIVYISSSVVITHSNAHHSLSTWKNMKYGWWS